jgi:hypothetical protein
MASEKVKIRLQGHEKFTVREGWINKALIELPGKPDLFTRKDSTDILGIGSNMVKSLRYWMKVFGLTNATGSELSDLGRIVAEHDPYLEKDFTLWVLHSKIAKNKEDATSWYMYFNQCDADELDKNEITSIIQREIRKYAGNQTFSEKSVANDVDAILNMYGKDKEKTDPEDKSVSPFARLTLVRKIEGRYIKNKPNKKSFSEMIVLFELVEKLSEAESISIDQVIWGENGLAKIYNLSGVMANEYFDRLDAEGYIRVDRTAGLDMIYLLRHVPPMQIIEDYYINN